jgi:Flp pilus assembly protein TadD
MDAASERICSKYVALAINGNESLALNGSGNAPSELGRYEEAIQMYDIALAIDASNADVLSDKGISLSKLGRQY